jgi:hypothetical protein
MIPNSAQRGFRRLAVAKTRRDGSGVSKCLSNTLRAQAVASGIKSNLILGTVLGWPQGDANPESMVIPKCEINQCATICAGPDRQSFQVLAFVLASVHLGGERPERVTRRKTLTEFNGCVLQPLGPTQRNYLIVRHYCSRIADKLGEMPTLFRHGSIEAKPGVVCNDGCCTAPVSYNMKPKQHRAVASSTLVRPRPCRSCATHENNRSCIGSVDAVCRQYNTEQT